MKFKESEKRELKKSTSELKEAIFSISAILNKHHGGDLYCPSDLMPQVYLGVIHCGISNDGTVIGKTIRDVVKHSPHWAGLHRSGMNRDCCAPLDPAYTAGLAGYFPVKGNLRTY